jgi:hypothetical protein
MARYFFPIRDGDEMIPDEDGHDLPNQDAVQKEAIQSAADLRQQAGRGVSFVVTPRA